MLLLPLQNRVPKFLNIKDLYRYILSIKFSSFYFSNTLYVQRNTSTPGENGKIYVTFSQSEWIESNWTP